jgi:ornithine cyclodeaminase/alanine dehydrogenase-like protein (mu-crystallin family)
MLQYLAPEGTTKLAILGSGVQARSHFQALSTVCKFKQVYIVGFLEVCNILQLLTSEPLKIM